MCNLNDAMMEQTSSVKQMNQEDIIEMMFREEQEEYFEQYFKDLQDSMNEHFKQMEVENGTI
jgi:hypothetical protein